MKIKSFVTALLFLAPPLFAAELPDSYDANPEAYKRLLENKAVRVMEMKLAPGDEIPMHRHDWPHFVYILDPGEMTITQPDGSKRVSESQAGELLWLEAKPHGLKNTGGTPVRALIAEVKTAD